MGSEIRFYDAGTWKEQAKYNDYRKQAIVISMVGMKINSGTPFPRKGNEPKNESIFYFNRLDTAVSSSGLEMSNPQLIAHGYVRNYANPNYVREYRLGLNHGADWHVFKDFRESYQSGWIESLRDKPILSVIIDKVWPREETALEFYQTSTQQKLNRMALKPNSHYRISRDGQWIAGLLNYKDQLDLYSTAPLIRWPGYLFLLTSIGILLWPRTKRIQVSGIPLTCNTNPTNA